MWESPQLVEDKCWQAPTDEWLGQQFDAAVTKLKLDADAGLPWRFLNPKRITKADVLEDCYGLIRTITINRLRCLATYDCSDPKYTPRDLVDLNCVDPVRVMIKNEPHPEAKAAIGRWRLIAVMAMVDVIVGMILFSRRDKLEIAANTAIPSKPGLSLNIEGLGDLVRYLARMPGPYYSTDVSGWDWCVTAWALLMDWRRRVQLSGLPGDSFWARASWSFFWAEMRSVFVTSHGEVYSLPFSGVVRSGSIVTSSRGSWVRLMTAWLTGARHAMAMGDDSTFTLDPDDPVSHAGTVEEAEAILAARYRKIGLRLKPGMLRSANSADFCSTRMTFDGTRLVHAECMSRERILVKFLNVGPNAPDSQQRFNRLKEDLRAAYGDEPVLATLAVLHSLGWRE